MGVGEPPASSFVEQRLGSAIDDEEEARPDVSMDVEHTAPRTEGCELGRRDRERRTGVRLSAAPVRRGTEPVEKNAISTSASRDRISEGTRAPNAATVSGCRGTVSKGCERPSENIGGETIGAPQGRTNGR